VKLEHVDRQQFLRTSRDLGALAALGPVVALLEGIKPTPIPTRVGATEIEQIRAAARVFQSWDRAYGGGVARDAVMGQLRWSVGLLRATCPARLRPELFSAVGDLADIAGRMALDVGAHEDARQLFHCALACAEQAGDWHLRAFVLDSLATQAIRTGQPDEGLTQAEHALVRADRLTATELALLHATRGRALAKMRRVNETLTAIGTAEDHFAHSTPANDPPYLAHYNAAFLGGGNGQALFDLALLGHNLAQATDRLTAAAAGHTAGRPRAFCLTKLASLTMATGDPIQAVAIGDEALDVAGTLRSHHVTDGGPASDTTPDEAAATTRQIQGGVPLWTRTMSCGERVCGFLIRCSPPRFRLAAGRAAPHRFLLAASRPPAARAGGRGSGRCGGRAAPTRDACTCSNPPRSPCRERLLGNAAPAAHATMREAGKAAQRQRNPGTGSRRRAGGAAAHGRSHGTAAAQVEQTGPMPGLCRARPDLAVLAATATVHGV
jgi:hypothetical protein